MVFDDLDWRLIQIERIYANSSWRRWGPFEWAAVLLNGVRVAFDRRLGRIGTISDAAGMLFDRMCECVPWKLTLGRILELFFHHHWWFGRHNESGRYAIKWPFVTRKPEGRERWNFVSMLIFWERNRIFYLFSVLAKWHPLQRHSVGRSIETSSNSYIARTLGLSALGTSELNFRHRGAMFVRDDSDWFSGLLDHRDSLEMLWRS